jgi:hypothetical protein
MENTALLTEQLRSLGLYAAPTIGDGNCLFRALSDQLYGSPSRHPQLRREVCDWIAGHKARYEPFVEDERGIEVHLRCMRENGRWQRFFTRFSVGFVRGATRCLVSKTGSRRLLLGVARTLDRRLLVRLVGVDVHASLPALVRSYRPCPSFVSLAGCLIHEFAIFLSVFLSFFLSLLLFRLLRTVHARAHPVYGGRARVLLKA